MKLYIIIPVHNRKTYTANCLKSLLRQTRTDFKIVVIDDGSTDGTSEMINRDFADVILLKGDGNLWWSAATNLGVNYALKNGADYIITLNDDTIAANDFIEKMIYWANSNPGALLGAFAIEASTKIPIYGGEIINWKTAGYKQLLYNLAPSDWTGLHVVSHYPGRGLLIPAEVFRKVGLYDAENFPQAVADDDFVHRATRAGYNVYCNYDAKLYTYPEESGDVKLRRQKSLKNYYNHLFGRKGGGNLKYFTIYALKNCPKKYIPLFLSMGIMRRVLGYLRDWLLESMKSKKNNGEISNT